MRPCELYVEGFKSYAEPTTFDFEGRGLFGIVGPTGSGKSSILDALIFGLYGKTLRLQRETKRLINSQAEEAKVRLAFEADGALWQVDRVIRRKGSSAVALMRLDRSVDPVAGDRNVNERIVELLGLDFDAFCSSVSLPQGEFDRFLNARKSERTEILKGLFRLDRVDKLREAAKGRAKLLEGQIQVFKLEVAVVPEDAEEAVGRKKALLAAETERLAEMQEALEQVLAAQNILDRSHEQLAQVEARLDQTRQALESMPHPAFVADVESQEDLAKRRLNHVDAQVDKASRALEEANARLAAAQQGARSEKWCSQVEGRLQAHSRLAAEIAAIDEELGQAEAQIIELRAQHVAAEAATDQAEKGWQKARSRLEELRGRHSAHHLRSGLRPGDDCPVCEQPVVQVPALAALPALQDAESRVAAAETELNSRRQDAGSTGRMLAVAEARKAAAAARLEDRRGALAEVAAALVVLAGPGVDPAAELEMARLAISAARQELEEQTAALGRAAALQAEARSAVDELSSARGKAVSRLNYLAGVLDVDQRLIQSETLVAAVKRIAEAGQLRLDALAQERGRLEKSAEQSAAKVAWFNERFQAPAGQTPSDVVAAARSRAEDLRRQIAAAEEMLARKAEAERQIALVAAEKALFDRLTGDLTDSKFTAYLLDEQRRLLARIASSKFFELTGRYVFDDDGEFNVIDQATGSTRTPDTLSGGETFLASLAMALALAEAVALEGGRLGCFFLDEGFGSLDPESLDLALEGIEALAVPGRLIGLISHVGGIQARLDDLIILEKKTDGTTVVCQDGGPMTFSPAGI